MTPLFSDSQVLFILLLCCGVLGYPAKPGERLTSLISQNRTWGFRLTSPLFLGWTSQESNLGGGGGGGAKTPSYAPLLSSWFPLLPPDLYHPAVSLLRGPEPTGFLSNARANIDDPPSWNPVLAHDLVRKSVTPYSTSKTSDAGALPPPAYIAGDLESYVGNVDQGHSETEAEQQPFGSWGPYPEPVFQAGELSQYESIFEHGNEERETDGDGFVPHYSFPSQGFWELPANFALAGPRPPSSQRLLKPITDDPLLPGQVPGALSHFHSKYEKGSDYWDEVGYGRFHHPKVKYEPFAPRTKGSQRLF